MTISVPKSRILSLLGENRLSISLLVAGFILFSIAAYLFIPDPFEWNDVFRPASLSLLAGQSPYQNPRFLNPPWLLIPILPFAVLPPRIGSSLFIAASIFIYIFTAYRMGARRFTFLLLLFSYPFLLSLWRAQIDCLVMLGFILPPPIGIFLVATKPQIGYALILYWAWEAWSKKRWIGLAELFLPVTFAFLISFAMYGFWPGRGSQVFSGMMNTSFFPQSIPIGLVLLVMAFRLKSMRWAMAASPFLSPYVPAYSWSVALLALAPFPLELAVAVIGVWAWQILIRFS